VRRTLRLQSDISPANEPIPVDLGRLAALLHRLAQRDLLGDDRSHGVTPLVAVAGDNQLAVRRERACVELRIEAVEAVNVSLQCCLDLLTIGDTSSRMRCPRWAFSYTQAPR
jgi:hypothetical protein